MEVRHHTPAWKVKHIHQRRVAPSHGPPRRRRRIGTYCFRVRRGRHLCQRRRYGRRQRAGILAHDIGAATRHVQKPVQLRPLLAGTRQDVERDGLLLYNDRLVISRTLRKRVLNVLHAAHQGMSSMTHCASISVFWPGISADIANRRAMCPTCEKHSPSLQQVPCPQSDPPTTPFECIAVDYFNLNGSHYLVCAD